MQANGTLSFLHTPRVGGTTFRWVMERNYPVGAIYADYREQDVIPVDALSPAHREKLRCVSSHQPFGTYDEFLNPPIRYVTLLRDPSLREVSQYYYRKRLDSHPLHEIARRASRQEYFEAVPAYHVDNRQVRMVSGQGDSGDVTAQSLARAKENLVSRITAFGLTERFHESLALMSRVLGWSKLTYVVRNRTHNRPADQDVGEDMLASVAALNRYDDQLYQFAASLFEQRLKEVEIAAEDAARVCPANGLETADHAIFRLRLRLAHIFRVRS